MTAHLVSEVGGVFALLALLHFLVDWGWQSHAEAIRKSTCAKCRAAHCLKYSVAMSVPLLLLVPGKVALLSLMIFWLSHFAIDTYIPVYLWASYFRKAPHFRDRNLAPQLQFKAFLSDPLGRIMAIVIDQSLHLVYLIPVAILVVFPHLLIQVAQATAGNLMILYVVIWLGNYQQ